MTSAEHRVERCPNGHPYTPENTVRRADGKGHITRKCRTCDNTRRRNWYARKTGKSSAPPATKCGASGKYPVKRQCPNGHLYTEGNTGYRPDGRRKCLTCETARTERNKQRRRSRPEVKRRVTNCPRGHAYTAENTAYAWDWTRICRTCRMRREYAHYLERHGLPAREPDMEEPPAADWLDWAVVLRIMRGADPGRAPTEAEKRDLAARLRSAKGVQRALGCDTEVARALVAKGSRAEQAAEPGEVAA